MKFDFIPLDFQYFDFKGRNYAKIYGRSKEGKRVCVIDSCDIYFWAILKDGVKEKKISKVRKKIESLYVIRESRKTEVIKTEVHKKNFLSKEVKAIKIFIDNIKDAHGIADKMDFPEIAFRREYDLNFITKYTMEKKVLPLNWYEVQGDLLNKSDDFDGLDVDLDVDFVIKAKSFNALEETKSKDSFFKPKILAYDIEVDEFEIGRGEILMISLVSEGFKKVITLKKTKKKVDYVEFVNDEKDLLERFEYYIKKLSPDIITGYFSDKFDLPYIKARAQKNKLPLKLGLSNSLMKFTGGRNRIIKLEGIIHIDLHRFIAVNYSQYLSSETLSLNEVSSELLNEKKVDFNIRHSDKLTESDMLDYFKYNLQDSVLTYKLAVKLWPDISEFSKIMHKPLFEVSRDAMSTHVEDYIIHNLYKFNEIVEKHPVRDDFSFRREAYEGAFVLEPKPGLYENIVMFDFTSMYGSIIVSYNLSKSTFSSKKIANSHKVRLEGKNIYFSKKQGFFPELLNEIINKRKQYKREFKNNPTPILKARSNAFKLIANAAYGYLGFVNARYFLREAAASTAALGRKNIKETIDKIRNKGFEVIYSDTDSIAFLPGKKSKSQINSFLNELNKDLPGIMELDLEGFFKRGLWVTTRSGNMGAKKKYALLSDDKKLKIRGFETVRRDWCKLARGLQNEVLKKILNDGNDKSAVSYTKKIIKNLKSRKISRPELIIRTKLKKPISEYKALGPHVIAAKLMRDKKIPISQGSLIEYYISMPQLNSKGKPKSKNIRDRVALVDDDKPYDIDYYLNNQVLPAVENIFQVFDLDIKGVIDGESQKKLF